MPAVSTAGMSATSGAGVVAGVDELRQASAAAMMVIDHLRNTGPHSSRCRAGQRTLCTEAGLRWLPSLVSTSVESFRKSMPSP